MKDYIKATRRAATQYQLSKTLLVVLFAGIVGVAGALPAVANDNIADKLSAIIIHPEAINQGEPFTLFAHVTNNSDKTLHLEIYASSRSHEDYDYRRQLLPVISSSQTLTPGESRYMAAGRYYYAGEMLNTNTIVLDDLVMRYSGPSQDLVSAPTLALPEISIDVLGTGNSQLPNPALYPIPVRGPLMVKDLADIGDNLLIHDPNTGYDWIQLAETTDLTLQDVEYALSTNQNLQDFQLARASQVKQLLLNHIHADGIAAQPNDLLLVSPHHLLSSIADFVDLFGPGQPLLNASVLYGAVADEPVARIITDIPMIAGLAISGHRDPPCDTFFCPAVGVRNDVILTESNDLQRPIGFWLVRGAPELTRPMDRASFLDDQLVIPALQIDGSYHRAVLSVLDLKLNLFVLTRLNPIEANEDAAEFQSATGILQLSDAVLMDAAGTTTSSDLTFRLIPETDPPVMELIGISE